jgi:hypothetical protein
MRDILKMTEHIPIRNIICNINSIKEYMINNNLLNPYAYYELSLIEQIVYQRIEQYNNNLITKQQLYETIYEKILRLNLIGYGLI